MSPIIIKAIHLLNDNSIQLDIVGDICASVGITTESFFVSGQKLCVPTGNISSITAL